MAEGQTEFIQIDLVSKVLWMAWNKERGDKVGTG